MADKRTEPLPGLRLGHDMRYLLTREIPSFTLCFPLLSRAENQPALGRVPLLRAAAETPKRPRKSVQAWTLVLSFVLTLVIINWVTWHVVEANALAGLYPPESDSLGIPIFGTAFLTLVMTPFSLLVVWLVTADKPWEAARSIAYQALLLGFLALLHLAGVLIVLSLMTLWADPDHWQIAASYMPLLSWFLLTTAMAVRRSMRK